MIAQLCQPKRLLIGHFSSKYEDIAPFLEEVRSIFPKSDLAIEGVTYLPVR
jgi:ribonuclease Z